ncbi:hypothetical protein B0H14DRAFT_3762260 [Mycena olivaceomarginata]|nr:hypothetical protein B0H14DRAFT_3762260 [Mycena olivaceomarginata]
MMQSTTEITKQRFTLLGYCAAAYPPYNPLSILLNRSLSRPLVRGESRLIILTRAIILSCIALGVPAFAMYAIVIKPANTLIYNKNVMYAGSPDPGLDTSTRNVTIFVAGFDYLHQLQADVSVVQNFGNPPVACRTAIFNTDDDGINPLALECPCKWSDVSTISISVWIPPETSGVFVYLWKGNTLPQYLGNEFYNGTSRINQYHGPASQLGGRLVIHTPLLSGSQLFGLLSWTKRRLITGGEPATVDVYIPQVTGLQPHPSSDTARANISVLTLRQPFGASVVEYFEEVTDDSPLSGVATFGGVWTFVNGAFALFFGANVIYFLFGRRPLSALGIVHILQRGALVRQWNADFPAIHTEGGLPGSEQAGIVAFIRERLVDLGERPMNSDCDKEDIEAQSFDSRAAHAPESEHEAMIVKDFSEKHVELCTYNGPLQTTN